MTKVLITGMSGLIGGLLRSHLEDVGGYELRALNRRPVEGVECFQADIGDLEAIKPAFAGQDVVVHLAAQVKADPNRFLTHVGVSGEVAADVAAAAAADGDAPTGGDPPGVPRGKFA